MSYSDSHFQSHHLNHSKDVTYFGWNRDEFPPPDEQASNASANGTACKNTDGNGDMGGVAQSSTHLGRINAYWDYFHDEEDWDMFAGLQVDCNGVVSSTRQGGEEAAPGGDGGPSAGATRVFGTAVGRRRTATGNWTDLALDTLVQRPRDQADGRGGGGSSNSNSNSSSSSRRV